MKTKPKTIKKNPTRKVKEVKNVIEIEEYTNFTFTYQENAINLTMALAQAGYFIQIRREGTGYLVSIYQHAK